MEAKQPHFSQDSKMKEKLGILASVALLSLRVLLQQAPRHILAFSFLRALFCARGSWQELCQESRRISAECTLVHYALVSGKGTLG